MLIDLTDKKAAILKPAAQRPFGKRTEILADRGEHILGRSQNMLLARPEVWEIVSTDLIEMGEHQHQFASAARRDHFFHCSNRRSLHRLRRVVDEDDGIG